MGVGDSFPIALRYRMSVLGPGGFVCGVRGAVV